MLLDMPIPDHKDQVAECEESSATFPRHVSQNKGRDIQAALSAGTTFCDGETRRRGLWT